MKTNLRAVDAVFEHSYGETHPCELNTAAGVADQTSDPELAALIAVAVLARSPYYLRHANVRGLASDGAILVGPYGGVLAVPPELRTFLATWQHERQHHADDRPLPLFLGNSHGRISQPAVRRRLARCHFTCARPAIRPAPDTRRRRRRGPAAPAPACASAAQSTAVASSMTRNSAGRWATPRTLVA